MYKIVLKCRCISFITFILHNQIEKTLRLFFIAMQLVYNIMLVTGVQQNDLDF